jgi:hypothetical protein
MKITLDLSDLTRKLPEIVKQSVAELQDVRNKVALDIFNDLVLTTPVDTGKARNGWQIDDAGGVVEITNNVEYIAKLNDGHSAQAPAGFIEAAVDRHTK